MLPKPVIVYDAELLKDPAIFEKAAQWQANGVDIYATTDKSQNEVADLTYPGNVVKAVFNRYTFNMLKANISYCTMLENRTQRNSTRIIIVDPNDKVIKHANNLKAHGIVTRGKTAEDINTAVETAYKTITRFDIR